MYLERMMENCKMWELLLKFEEDVFSVMSHKFWPQHYFHLVLALRIVLLSLKKRIQLAFFPDNFRKCNSSKVNILQLLRKSWLLWNVLLSRFQSMVWAVSIVSEQKHCPMKEAECSAACSFEMEYFRAHQKYKKLHVSICSWLIKIILSNSSNIFYRAFVFGFIAVMCFIAYYAKKNESERPEVPKDLEPLRPKTKTKTKVSGKPS